MTINSSTRNILKGAAIAATATRKGVLPIAVPSELGYLTRGHQAHLDSLPPLDPEEVAEQVGFDRRPAPWIDRPVCQNTLDIKIDRTHNARIDKLAEKHEALDFLEGPDPEGPSLAELAELAAKPKSKRTFYLNRVSGVNKIKNGLMADDPLIATVRAYTLAEATDLFAAHDITVKRLTEDEY